MQPQLVNKEQTYSIGQWMVDNFDVAFQSITSSWLVEHTQDDTHGDITCWSVTVNAGVANPNTGLNSTGNITGGGVLTMNGTGVHRVGGNLIVNQAGSALASTDNAVQIGNVGGIIPTDGRTGPGISLLLGTSKRFDVVLYNDGGPNPYGLRVIDMVNNATPLELAHDPIGGTYWLAPGENSAGALEIDLGTAYYGGVLGKWQNLFLSGNITAAGTINGITMSQVVLGSINDNLLHTFSPPLANQNCTIIVGSTAGNTIIPIFSNGGSGVVWHFTVLNPSVGWVINGSGISFSFTDGSGTNTYTFAINGGSSQASIQRTAGAAAYVVSLLIQT